MPRPIALAVLLTAACATSTPQKPGENPAAAAEAPQRDPRAELMAAAHRELEKASPARAVVGPGGLFRAQVEAAAEPEVEDGEKSVTVTIPIGTKEPVLCFVYKGSIDAGVSMRNMVDALAKSVEIKAVHPVEMAAVGGRPAVFVELVYVTTAEGGEKAVGHVKLMASAVDPTAAVCLHDELGYSQTFRRVTKSFLENLTPRPRAPRFAEISVFRVDGVPVGIEHRRVWDRKEGGTIQEDSSVLLVLKSESEFVVEDTAAGETGDAEGRLDSYSYLKARDGEVLVTAEVKRVSSGGYEAKGTNEGKDFKASLKPVDKKGLPTDLFIQRALRDELLGGGKKELAVDRYDASADPTRLSQAVYRRGAGAREVEFASGDVRYTGTVSPEGTIEKMAMPLDGHEMTMERVFASGSP